MTDHTEDTRKLDAAREEFDADVIYLNTATLGLPPRRSWEALQAALAEWRAGVAKATDYDAPVTRARRTYAALVGVDPQLVAVGSQVSVFAGLIAASLPNGAEVLTATGDFTSILFPFHVQAGRGITVREVPLERLPDAVRSETSLVSLSAVQSADGRVADLDALRRSCAATGTNVLLDTTQAIGWLPIDASQFAYMVCGGYKWLLAPRGTAYLTVRRDLLDHVVPHAAGWYAGADPWNSLYGMPLRLSTDARRFDASPAWHCWVGAAPALELLSEIGTAALHAHALGLANRFRAGVGLPAGNSAIVSSVGDPEGPDLLTAANIVCHPRWQRRGKEGMAGERFARNAPAIHRAYLRGCGERATGSLPAWHVRGVRSRTPAALSPGSHGAIPRRLRETIRTGRLNRHGATSGAVILCR